MFCFVSHLAKSYPSYSGSCNDERDGLPRSTVLFLLKYYSISPRGRRTGIYFLLTALVEYLVRVFCVTRFPDQPQPYGRKHIVCHSFFFYSDHHHHHHHQTEKGPPQTTTTDRALD